MLHYQVQDIPLEKLPRTRTKIMMNVGNPEEAFSVSAIPNDGVGLARMEFIIANYIKAHPLALIHYENPMLGWRGASRYYDERYREGFTLECQAMKKVRDEMGLTNVILMVPFCRTPSEGRRVLAEMVKNGLVRGQNNLQIYVMCELPSNIILASEFSEIFEASK